jgi:hypothetical protein
MQRPKAAVFIAQSQVTNLQFPNFAFGGSILSYPTPRLAVTWIEKTIPRFSTALKMGLMDAGFGRYRANFPPGANQFPDYKKGKAPFGSFRRF